MRTTIQRIRPAECLGRICPEGDLARGQQRTAEAPIIEICRFESLPLPTSRSSRGRTRMPGLSCRRMGTQPSGLTATQGGSMRRQTSRASTVSSSPTRMDLSPSSPSRQVRTRRTQRSPALGTPMPTTTSSTAWPRCVGMGLRGRSSDLRRNTRIIYDATLTKRTYRCDARSNPSDSKSAERSRWPTVRSASPTTGSRSHHTTAPHGCNSQSNADASRTFACNSPPTQIDDTSETS